jgi:hypothetical protein
MLLLTQLWLFRDSRDEAAQARQQLDELAELRALRDEVGGDQDGGAFVSFFTPVCVFVLTDIPLVSNVQHTVLLQRFEVMEGRISQAAEIKQQARQMERQQAEQLKRLLEAEEAASRAEGLEQQLTALRKHVSPGGSRGGREGV